MWRTLLIGMNDCHASGHANRCEYINHNNIWQALQELVLGVIERVIIILMFQIIWLIRIMSPLVSDKFQLPTIHQLETNSGTVQLD